MKIYKDHICFSNADNKNMIKAMQKFRKALKRNKKVNKREARKKTGNVLIENVDNRLISKATLFL